MLKYTGAFEDMIQQRQSQDILNSQIYLCPCPCEDIHLRSSSGTRTCQSVWTSNTQVYGGLIQDEISLHLI